MAITRCVDPEGLPSVMLEPFMTKVAILISGGQFSGQLQFIGPDTLRDGTGLELASIQHAAAKRR